MAFVIGTRCYGYVDRIPGIGCVATQFFHINFIPLVPVKSFFIVEGSESGDGFRGRELSVSGRSVLAGYLRGWGVFACVIAAGLNWYSLGDAGGGENWVGVVAALVGLGLVAGAAFFWNRLWMACQGLFHLGSLGGWAAVAVMGRSDGFLDVTTVWANGLLLVYALTRLMDNAGHRRAGQLMELMGYDRETAEEILEERNPRRQTAGRDDDEDDDRR